MVLCAPIFVMKSGAIYNVQHQEELGVDFHSELEFRSLLPDLKN